MKKKKDKESKKKCKCGNKAKKPHQCPFARDVLEDSKTLCNCCEKCQRQCAQEI